MNVLANAGKVIQVDTDAVVITLPATLASLEVIIQNIAANAAALISISPAAADLISGPDIAGTNDRDQENTKLTSITGDYMKLIGNGDFRKFEDRKKSIRYAMKCGLLNAAVIGFKSTAEIDEAIKLMNEALAETAKWAVGGNKPDLEPQWREYPGIDITPNNIYVKIKGILENKREISKIVLKGKDYLAKYHDYKKVMSNVVSAMNNTGSFK